MKLGRKILLMLLAIFATTVVAAGIYLTTTYNYATGDSFPIRPYAGTIRS